MLNERIIVVSPHADDELFGCGGTLLKYKERGAKIKCVLVTCSDLYMHHLGRVVKGSEREYEFAKVCEHISTEPFDNYKFNDAVLDTVPIMEIVKRLEETIRKFKPTIVFLPEPSYHQDHQVVHRAMISALRPTGYWQPSSIYLYEVPTSVWHGADKQFSPNVYVDIGDLIHEKCRLLKECYPSQYSDDRGLLAEKGMRFIQSIAVLNAVLNMPRVLNSLESD